MAIDTNFVAARFDRFAQDVIAPAIYTDACPLDAAAFQCADPTPLADAERATFNPVRVGWEWGPVWSSAWFRVRGAVPPKLGGAAVVLRFSAGTEALVWRHGEPWQGLDLNRDAVALFGNAETGATIDLLIEAACNHNLGQLGTHWDPAEFRARWQSERPGRFERCEIAAFDEAVWRLHGVYLFAVQLMKELPGDSARAQDLAGALRRATNMIEDGRVGATAEGALRVIEASLRRRAGGSAPICHAVGHAHIDTAWLWPIRETKRKCLRTFASALANIERFPEFRFLCSQAQQYAWVEEKSPELFRRIGAAVAEGRWEVGGAMWIEPDCNLVSGESLIRQILHGVRYWREKFDVHAEQTYVYLPDTFGFTPALPQIMRLAGLETFITHKLSWNQTNRWPHTHFVWRGIDGSEVVAHQMPGHDYNLRMTPRELRRGEQNHTNIDQAGVVGGSARYLQPFGFGDGGGGPTAGQILNGALAADCEGMPRVHFSRVGEFCAALHADRAALREVGEDFPVWEGELYLEAHRGTYTTQAWLKRANRRAEEGLHAAEALTWAGPAVLPVADAARAREELDAAWKQTLLNQFHDIIPGSSIGWVYKDAAEQLEGVRKTVDSYVQGGLERLAARLSTAGCARPLMIFNPTSAAAGGVVEHGEDVVHVEEVPALGVRVVDAAHARLPASGPARFTDGLRMSNGVIDAGFDECGRLVSLRRAAGSRELCAPGRALGELVLYEDHPRNWDAWDIDPEYSQKGRTVEMAPGGVSIMAMGPLRTRLSVQARLGARSSVAIEYTLDAGSPRLDMRLQVEWRETHRLLRALFPTTLRSDHATFECAFGHVRRSTRRNTSWERAAFEVPGHRWVDLTDDDGGAGIGVLNDCKYGHSCHDGVIGMSLLRAPTFPDEAADIGRHVLAYSLVPHEGDWRSAGVDRHAALLNTPLKAVTAPSDNRGELGSSWSPFTLENGAGVAVAACKIAEEDDRLILRLVETRGRQAAARIRWNIPVSGIEAVNLHERPHDENAVLHDAAEGVTSVAFTPFRIVTLGVERTR